MRRFLFALLIAVAPALLAADSPSAVPQAVAALEHLKPKADVGPFSWTAGPYHYDAAGNITAIGSETFVYDKLGRLKSATVRGPDLTTLQTQTFGYDDYGNLTSTSKLGQTVLLPVTVSTNRLTLVAYDAAGNIVTSGIQHYDYDAVGTLNAVRLGDNLQPRIVYAYTADDERLFAFDVSANTTHWTLRGLDNKVLRDLEQEGNSWSVERDYVYRDGLLLAALKPGGAVEHYTVDHLGTPRLITDGAGHKIGYHVYWPFGEEWSPGNPQEGSPLQFTGHERDPDPTGGSAPLDYMHARFYGAGWGRFLTPDPYLDVAKAAGAPQQWNRYAYVSNSPLSRIDPDGRSEGIITGLYWAEHPEVINADIHGGQMTMAAGAAAAIAYFGSRVAPSATQALLTWALTHPTETRQLADAVLSPPGSSALPTSLAEETFNHALANGSEKIAGFTIDGSKGMVGSTFNRNVLYLSGAKGGTSSVGGLFKALESEAKVAGATRISIVGLKIINSKLFNAAIAKRYGYTLRQINSETVQLVKDIK